MALNIKDPETDMLVRRLAKMTGEKITDAVKTAVKERLDRQERLHQRGSIERIMAIAREYASLPVVDPRTPEEMLYDEYGLPK